MRAWADVAFLATVKNLDGGLVVRSTSGLPFLLSEGTQVAFVPPVTDMPRRSRVVKISPIDDASALVRFDGVEDVDTARALCGCHVLMRRGELPELARATVAANTEGEARFAVRDVKAGLLGTLMRVDEMPGQNLLVVAREGAAVDAQPLLIPLVDEFVKDVDEDALCISVDVPRGLLEL